MTLMTKWAMDGATEAAERLGLGPDAVVKTTGTVGLRLPGGQVATIPVRSSYPRAQLLRLARKLMKAGWAGSYETP